jgi:plastocyanin
MPIEGVVVMGTGRCAVLVGAFMALLTPATAGAATKTVFAGPAGSAGGTFLRNPPTADLDSFSLQHVTVHVGDRVRWVFRGLHTVTFPQQGGSDIPFVVPDPTGTKYAGIDDAAGAPFWFNGQTRLIIDPRGGLPQGGRTEDGSKVTGSGIRTPADRPYTLRFPKKGVYHYECVIHPGMEGTVRVAAKRARIPTPVQDARAQARQLAKDARIARQLARFTPPPGTVSGGHDRGQVVQFAFFPPAARVSVGGTLRLTVTSRAEAHTFSFGPPDYLNRLNSALIVPVPSRTGPPTLVFNGQVAFPSDPPPTLPPYRPTLHGNGFLNTGLLDGDPRTPDPSSTSVTFAQAGTYSYICLLHPWMHGTVTVG